MKLKRWKFQNVFFVVLTASVVLFAIAHIIHPKMGGWMPPIGELLSGTLCLAALIYAINRLLASQQK